MGQERKATGATGDGAWFVPFVAHSHGRTPNATERANDDAARAEHRASGVGRGAGAREYRDAGESSAPWFCSDVEIQHTEPCYTTHSLDVPYVMQDGAHDSASGAFVAWRTHRPHSGECATGATVFVARESSGVSLTSSLTSHDAPRMLDARANVETCADCRASGHVACDHVQGTTGDVEARPCRVTTWDPWDGTRATRAITWAWFVAHDSRADADRAALDALRIGVGALDAERYVPHVCPREPRATTTPATAPRHDATRLADDCRCVACSSFLASLTSAQRRARRAFVARRRARVA